MLPKSLKDEIKDDEKVELVLRRHWFVFLAPMAKPVLFIFVPLAIILWLFGISFFMSLLESFLWAIIIAGWFFFWLLFALYEWFVWYFDIFILTDKRIIDVEQKSLFSKNVSEITYDKIQDTSYQVSGIAQTFLKFGTINVQTAGSDVAITINDVAAPAMIQEKISELSKKYGESRNTAKEEILSASANEEAENGKK